MITEETAIGTKGTNLTKIPFWSFLFRRKNKAQVKAEITEKLEVHKAVKTESFIATYKFLFDKTKFTLLKAEKIKEKNGNTKKKIIKLTKIDKNIF